MRGLLDDERGMAAVLAAFIMLVIVALAGLVIDGGLLLYNEMRLEQATVAAARATRNAYDVVLWETQGIVELDPYLASKIAKEYLAYNLPEATVESCEVRPPKKNEAIVKTKVEVETIFVKIFGIDKKIVRSEVTGITR